MDMIRLVNGTFPLSLRRNSQDWQGVFGNVIVSQNFMETMGNPSASLLGTMASVYTLGCFFGAVSTIWTGDMLGRPKTILVGSGTIAVGAVLQAAAFGVPEMIVGRIIVGLGTGMNTATAGVWQAETSKAQSRGKLVMIHMVRLFGATPPACY